MKTILVGALLLFSSLSFAKEIKVNVQGMVCSMCAQGIQKKFSSVPEVKTLNVNLDEKTVRIQTEGDKDVSDEVIKKLIQEAGYNVASIERK
jgi:mercuric ion binding protein